MSSASVLQAIMDAIYQTKKLITTDLIRIFVWRDSSLVDSWKNEIYNLFNHIEQPVTRDTYMKEDRLYSNFYGKFSGTVEELIDIHLEIAQKGLDLPAVSAEQVNPKKVEKFVSSYFKWLSHNLSLKGRVSLQGVFNIIDDLLQKNN